MSFHNVFCSHCYATEERYYNRSTDPHCSFCGNYLNGEKKLTSEEYYKSMGVRNEAISV